MRGTRSDAGVLDAGLDAAEGDSDVRDVFNDVPDSFSDAPDVSIDVELDVAADAGAPALVAQFDCDTAPMFDRLSDVTGNGHDARCDAGGCPTLSPGRPGMGTACRFSGAERLRISNHPDFSGIGGFTTTAWINPDRAGFQSVIGKPAGPSRCNSWQIFLGGSANPIRFVSAHGAVTTSEDHDSLSGPSIPQATWTHVAVSYDGMTKRLYVNGEEILTSVPSEIVFQDRDIFIGADQNAIDGESVFALPYDGQVDDIRYYDRALSGSQLRGVYEEFP